MFDHQIFFLLASINSESGSVHTAGNRYDCHTDEWTVKVGIELLSLLNIWISAEHGAWCCNALIIYRKKHASGIWFNLMSHNMQCVDFTYTWFSDDSVSVFTFPQVIFLTRISSRADCFMFTFVQTKAVKDKFLQWEALYEWDCLLDSPPFFPGTKLLTERNDLKIKSCA